jgi:predicted transcriptional regulator of viral defense system
MNIDLPNLEAEIRKASTTAEINRIIDVVKAQQKIVRVIESSKTKLGLRPGDLVTAAGRNGSITGTIVRIKKTKAIVKLDNGTRYDVPLPLIKPIGRAA